MVFAQFLLLELILKIDFVSKNMHTIVPLTLSEKYIRSETIQARVATYDRRGKCQQKLEKHIYPSTSSYA